MVVPNRINLKLGPERVSGYRTGGYSGPCVYYYTSIIIVCVRATASANATIDPDGR